MAQSLILASSESYYKDIDIFSYMSEMNISNNFSIVGDKSGLVFEDYNVLGVQNFY